MNHKRNIGIGVLITLAIVFIYSLRMMIVVVGGLTEQDRAAVPDVPCVVCHEQKDGSLYCDETINLYSDKVTSFRVCDGYQRTLRNIQEEEAD